MDPTIPTADLERRRAADLRPGDLAIFGDLLGSDVLREVRFAEPYTLDGIGPRVLVVHRRTDDPYLMVERLSPDDWIAVAPVLDETARACEDGDGTPVPDGVYGEPEGAGPNRHTEGAPS